MADTEQTALAKTNNATQEISIKSAESDIKSMIYVIRNQQVMIDSDLAMLYQVETRVLNQAVKRNISRFPERFRFQLTKEEYENLKSQFVISSLEDDMAGVGNCHLYSQNKESQCFLLFCVVMLLSE